MRRRLRGPVVLGGLVGVAALAPLASPAATQEDTTRTARLTPVEPPSTGGWGAVAVLPRPGTTVVSVTMALPVGSARDREGREGTAALLARAIVHDVRDALEPSARAATEVAAEVERERTVFRLMTLPRHWASAYRLLERSVFELVPSPRGLERARAERLEVLTFEDDSPVQEFRREMYRTVAGAGSPWSRPVRGTLASVGALDVTTLADFRSGEYRRGDATVAVVGAVSPDDAAEIVVAGRLPDRGTVVSPSFAPTRPATAAWEAGRREQLEREVTSSWITVAYPVPPELEWTPLEMLLHRLEAHYNTDPPDPDLFHASVRVEELDGAPVLMIEAAVLPEATTAWEARIVRGVEELRDEVLAPPFFRWYRRRFRSDRLLEAAAPEAEGLRVALDLLRSGGVRDQESEIWNLDGSTLRAAARALGAPRIVVFGPNLSEPTDR